MSRWFSGLRIVLALVAAVALSTALPARAAIAVPACTAETAPANQPIMFDCGSSQNKFGPGDFSVPLKFAPIKSNSDDPLVFRMISSWQDGATVRFSYADGHVFEHSYQTETASRFLTIGGILEFRIPARDASLHEITVLTRESVNLRGIVLEPKIMTRSESEAIALKLSVLYGIFIGLALSLIIYNLALWAAARQSFQLAYCAMVAAMVAICFTASGAVTLMFPGLADNDRLRSNYLLYTLAGLAAMAFFRGLLGAKVYDSKLTRGSAVLVWILLTVSLVITALAPAHMWLLQRLYYLVYGIVLIWSVPVLIQAWQTGGRYVWLVVCAWSVPLVAAFLRLLVGFDLIESSFLLTNGNLIAMAIESLVSTMLVTVRLRDLRQERDLALVSERSARRLASTDPLTGMLNRRAFLDLAIGLESGQRLMLIDIDHFKAINDRVGHAGGDEVLRAVAKAIQTCRPPQSLAVRLGGEEFAILLPVSAARDYPAARVLAAVREHSMPLGAQVTISLGYADGMIENEADWKRLYKLADAALYRAKRDGRDRASLATNFRAVA